MGKSSVARALAARLKTAEVASLARALGASRGGGRAVEVDLGRLRSRLGRPGGWGGAELVVGHLAHLLPVRGAIVLRCHPLELRERLRRARRGTVTDRQANYVAEATDLVLLEVLRSGVPVAQIDTSGRTVEEVARAVLERLRRPWPRRVRSPDWLADRSVTAHLLDRPT